MGKSYISTFVYDCEFAFNSSKGTSVEVPKDFVKYIIIEHDYNKRIMPIIYIKVNLLPSVYNQMVPDQGRGKIYLKLYRSRRIGATSSAPKTVIYDEFDYYMTDDPNTYRKLDTINEEKGTAYKTCIIGLVKIDLQKKNQKTFEGIFKNTNTMSLIQSATSNMKMVIQPFDNNKYFSTFMCPTIPTIAQFISYINSKASFYKGSYMYYMDLDKTYLRSNDGSYIDAKDGDFKYVAFDVRDLTHYQALTSGMVEDQEQDAYIVYVSGSDAQIIIDRVTSNLVGQIEGIDAGDGTKLQTARVDTSYITNIGTSGSIISKATVDTNFASNLSTRAAESSDTMIVTKIDMDSKVFTPNKQYLLCNYEDNPKYCGVYFMTCKKEIYLRNGAQMSCQMTITFKKCADFV